MNRTLIRVLIGLALADFLAAIDVTAVNVALPRISELLHLTPAAVSLLQIVYTVLLILILIPIGKAGDIKGHKRSFLLGLFLFGLASLCLIAASSFPVILILRGIQGLGAGILFTTSGALVAYHWKKTEMAFGVTAAFFSVGMLVGPLLGGYLTSISLFGSAGWHWIFAINVPVVLISGWLISRFATETERRPEGSLDTPSLLLLALFLITLVAALLQNRYRIELFSLAALSLLGMAVLQTRVRNPLLNLDLFRSQTFQAISVFTFIAMLTVNALSFINTFFLQDVLHFSPSAAGIHLLPLPLGMAVFAGVAGSFRNWKVGALIASILIMAGLFVLALVTPATPYFAGLFWGYLLVSAGGGFMMTNTFAAALGSVKSELSGLAAGYINTVQQLGTVAGIAFVAGQNLIVQYQPLYLYLTALATIALLASLFVKQTSPK